MLRRDKFRRWLSTSEAAQFVAAIRILADIVPDPPAASNRETADPKDEFLVALARGAGVVALISGAPDLTDLVSLDPPVQTPAAFLDYLSGRDVPGVRRDG